MMCSKCGEPWETDVLHDELEERHPDEPWVNPATGRTDQGRYERDYFDPLYAEFRRDGCKAIGSKCNGNTASPAVSELMDLLGDDVDGANCELDDARALGLL